MTDEDYEAIKEFINAVNGDKIKMEPCGLTLQWDKKTGNIQKIPAGVTREQCIALFMAKKTDYQSHCRYCTGICVKKHKHDYESCRCQSHSLGTCPLPWCKCKTK